MKIPQERIDLWLAHARRLAARAQRLAGESRAVAGRLAGQGARLGRSSHKAVGEMVRAARARLSRQMQRYLRASDGRAPEAVVDYGPPARAPEGRRIYAVGDIHGRADLLGRLLKDIEQDALGGDYRGKPVLIFLGDYVDRGFQSRDVIDLLLGESLSQFETHFLKGNHEAAMLQFLNEPGMGPRWAEFGGSETLASYGVRPPRSRMAQEEWALASQELNRVLPPAHLHFLSSLELSVRLGDYMFVHAGVKPGVEMDKQSEYDLLWIREEFLNDKRPLGATVVHGHTPAPEPHRDGRRVGLDTGAYLSGRLTAARFEHEDVVFLTTGPPPTTGAAQELMTGGAG